MKLGMICRADTVGLGSQTWEAYRALLPDKAIIIDLSALGGTPQHFEWYPGVPHVTMAQWQQSTQWMDEFLDGLDVVFSCETCYRDDFYSYARHKGVKVALQANFEFLPWATSPHLPVPDALWMSSLYRYNDVPDTAWGKKRYMPTPVARDRCQFVERSVCSRFLHVVGRKTDLDRNGTALVIAADDLRLSEGRVVYTNPRTIYHEPIAMPGCNVMVEPDEYWKLYAQFECFVSPRRYAGQSLTMQEALSCGLPVISLDIDPQSWWLPKEWLVPARPMASLATMSGPVEVFTCNAEDLAIKMDTFASASNYREYSQHANEIAKTLDWNEWQQPYLDALREVAFPA